MSEIDFYIYKIKYKFNLLLIKIILVCINLFKYVTDNIYDINNKYNNYYLIYLDEEYNKYVYLCVDDLDYINEV